MATMTETRTVRRTPVEIEARRDPGYSAFWILRLALFAVPVMLGLDAFFDWMRNWDTTIWSEVPDALPGSSGDIAQVYGGVSMALGVLTLLMPRLGAPLLTGWLAWLSFNFAVESRGAGPDIWDLALLTAGLALAALALTLLAWTYRSVRRDIGDVDDEIDLTDDSDERARRDEYART